MSADFTITRSTVVDAPAEVVYRRVADFRGWRTWSPWESADPNLSREYSGAESGEGARYAWAGNRNAGAGSMEVTAATPPSELHIGLHFTKPFKVDNRVLFTFVETGSGRTEVTWTMHSRKLLPMRLLGPLVDMDKMIGPDFEKGLAALKAECEQG